MYMKNLNHKMTLRLTDELKEYIDGMATAYGISPSDYIRQCVYQIKASQEKAETMLKSTFDEETIKKLAKEFKEGLENGTDRKTAKHNSV